MTLVHWDDVEPQRHPLPAAGGLRRRLGDAAGSRTVGVNLIELAPGEISSPAHVHGADEEIFFVLRGGGLSWQDGTTLEVRAGDTIVHRVRREAHTLRAGDDGLDVLAFGTRTRLGGAYLPPPSPAGRRWLRHRRFQRQAGLYWLYPSWSEAGTGDHPFAREQGLEWPAPSPRPETIVHLDDLEGEYGGIVKHPGREAGAVETGLNWIALPPGEEGSPPHCHSVEEELFVVLDGEGQLELWARPDPEQPLQTEPAERHPVRRGHVVSRPAGTRIPHSLRAGDGGLTYLAYGTREPSDMCWYPRSNKVFLRGLGVIARLELLDYFDGEPS